MMKNQKKSAGAVKILAALSMMALLAACGGGGGSGTPSNTSGTSGGTGTGTPTVQNATDPYTGAPATGSPTTQISGQVVSGPTTGAAITAYALNSDGTNGNAIGTATTDSTGSFTMTFAQAPTGMIRLVATGGTFTSEADNSTQKNDTLELVAPYVTTTLNSFVITPVTYYASQRITYLTSKGTALLQAYSTASSAALSIVNGNDAIDGNVQHAGVDYLSIVPGSAQDTLNAYSDALTALEDFGVQYDLPSSDTLRILIATSITGTNGVTDQNGQPVNVGTWSSGTFDVTQPPTVATLTGGVAVSTSVALLVQQMNAVTACTSGNHAPYYQRFPLPSGESDYLTAQVCQTDEANMNAISAKVSTNNRSKFTS